MAGSGGSDEIVTIFRSRLRPDAADAYAAEEPRIEALARVQPGFVEIKTFTSEDGERVAIVTFADRESHDAWRDHPQHLEVQERGRTEFYESYRILVCRPEVERSFP